MSTIICDFMGDKHLQKIAEALIRKKDKEFLYLISHTIPHKKSNLSNLEHLDSNLLYNSSGLSELDLDCLPVVGLDKNKKFLECMQTFLICFDRIDPIGMPVKQKIIYFWHLLGFYEKYFKKRPDITSIIFCNVPHMPWDIVLFYYAKLINVKTIVLRKTGIGGYLYIDEDFRPHKSKFTHRYVTSQTFKTQNNIKDLSIIDLQKMNFTQGMVSGMWKLDVSYPKRVIKFIAKLLKLKNFLTTLRILISTKPSMPLYASQKTKQVSTFGAYRYFSWANFLFVHFKFQSKMKKISNYYKSICLKGLPNKKFVYVALHFQPERSTNPEGSHFDEQALMLKIISQSIPEDWCIIVKEHPKQFMYDLRSMHARNIELYKIINKLKNLYFIGQGFVQSELIEKSVITASVAGSVGWESLLKRKPTLVFSQNWHTSCEASKYVYDLSSTKSAIREYIKMSPDKVERVLLKFVKNISPFLINGALNKNHVCSFIAEGNEDMVVDNVAHAIIERLEN
ncbi:hypothetical protein OAS37_02240 [Alphaproteobacteria bacterium]|nr:hypothetical protein [Alphaproteobacteria bacterium]